jgi:hypothetical protein
VNLVILICILFLDGLKGRSEGRSRSESSTDVEDEEEKVNSFSIPGTL